MLSKVSIVLCLGCILCSLEMWANGSVPDGLSLLLGLLNPVCTICSVLLLSEASGRCIDLVFKSIDLRLDLLDMGSKVGLVVGVQVGRRIGSNLQIRSANARRRIVQLCQRRWTSKGGGKDKVPYRQPVFAISFAKYRHGAQR